MPNEAGYIESGAAPRHMRSVDTPEGIAKLREAGIPGIKYLDRGSRGVDVVKAQARLSDVQKQIANASAIWGNQAEMRVERLREEEAQLQDAIKRGSNPTHNFVVFDDKLIDIIKKYGLAGLIAGGAAHFQMTPTDAKAEGFKRGGAAQTDDDITLTEEELAQVNRAWKELIEQHAHRGQMHYTMPPVRGMPPPGSFRIPKDVFAALGDGDLKVGGAVVHSMFGVEDDPEDPTVVHPHVVRIIGHGNLAAGHKVLGRFVVCCAGKRTVI